MLFQKDYKKYQQSLLKANLMTLSKRRHLQCLNFANKASSNKNFLKLFPPNRKNHKMSTRNKETFLVPSAKSERFRKSSIPYMINTLNQDIKSQTRKRKIYETYTHNYRNT